MRAIGPIAWVTLSIALFACESAAPVAEPLTATPPPCAAACVGPAGAAPEDLDCIRDACAPADAPSPAGVAWRGVDAEDADPSGAGARFVVRSVETDALYASLVDAWHRCRSHVSHRTDEVEDWQIRFYAPERDLLAMWSWLERRVVFLGAVEAGVDGEDRAVWTLPGGASPDDPGYLSPAEARGMAHELLAVDVCGG